MSVTTFDLFGTTDPAEVSIRTERLKAALDKAAGAREARHQGGQAWSMETGWTGGVDPGSQAGALATLGKSVSSEVLASLTAALDQAGALQKDISLTSPLASGLVPFDLEESAKILTPVLSPLRNDIPRVKGQGTARRFKRITGISGSGTGGIANLSPFLNDSSTIGVGSLTLRRGAKISYASDDKTYNYKQFGLSDVVTWSAEFAGLGFTDVRQLSQTALLYATMMAEERAIIAGRGTDAGVYVGTLATPPSGQVALTVRAAGVGETGNSAVIANLFVRVSAEGMFGESIASAEVTTAGLAALTGRVIDVTMTGAGVSGATGYKVYVGTATGLVNQFFAGRTGCWGGVSGLGTASFSIQFTGAGVGGTPSTGANGSATDTASSADAYDGILTVQTDPTQSGAIFSAGAGLSASSIGIEFQQVFTALYAGLSGNSRLTGVASSAASQGVKADPDEIWLAGQDRKQLSALFLSGGSGNPTFFMNVASNSDGMRMGQVVTAMLNEVTGKEVACKVHPYLPQGTSLVLSRSLPTPDSQVPAPFQMVLPQDYLAIPWPVIQHTYDQSSYGFGALVHYAPAFSGVVKDILAV